MRKKMEKVERRLGKGVKVKLLVAQSCLTLYNSMDYSPPDFSVYGIFFQARILEPFPSLGDLPDPGIKLGFPELWADSLLSEPAGKPNIWSI